MLCACEHDMALRQLFWFNYDFLQYKDKYHPQEYTGYMVLFKNSSWFINLTDFVLLEFIHVPMSLVKIQVFNFDF